MPDAQQDARPGDELLDELLVDLLGRLTEGEEGAVEAACARHPELAAEIRARLAALGELNLLPSDAAAMAFPERLGDFRLLRRLGGGGMGVVYEAVQESLGRVVALKLIRPEHLYFDKSRERFRRETDAVARLSHPGIVTIHTVGEAQGTPYFAMELIRGATLAQVIEQVAGIAPESLLGSDLRAAVRSVTPDETDRGGDPLPELFAGSWSEACTRVILRMGDALVHAHGRGVLHRDIKPSNIAVTADGRVVLLDFGLAGLEHELRLTASGSALGSVLYMAPEQLSGSSDKIDERTDVYALGVTLYELLTLRAPYGGSDSEQARAAILEGRPPPIRLRQRNVSRDLELVCLKAMDADRTRRYATMEDFGEDLRNALEGRSIRARPPTAAYRLRRWVRAHPATTTAVAAAALMVLVLPTLLYLQQRSNNDSLQRALEAEKRSRQLAADEGERANARAREADEVANFLVQLFAASDPYSAGRRDVTARELLADGLARVETDLSNQPELQANLFERIGASYTNLDLYSQAIPPLRRALELRRSLNGDGAVETASTKVLLASATRLAGKPGGAALLREALLVFEREPALGPAGLINTYTLLAACLMDEGAVDEPLDLLAHARVLASEVPDGDDEELKWMVANMLASTYQRLGRHAEAEGVAREAVALTQGRGLRARPWQVASLSTLGLALSGAGRLVEARSVYEELMPQARSFYGDGNVVYAQMQIDHAMLLARLGGGPSLADALLPPFQVLRTQLGPADRTVLQALEPLIEALLVEQRAEEGARLLHETLEALLRAELPDAAGRSRVLHLLGLVAFSEGNRVELTRLLRESLALARESGLHDDGSARALLAYARVDDPDGRGEAVGLAESLLDSPSLQAAAIARCALVRLALAEGRDGDVQRLLDGLPATDAAQVPWAVWALRIRRGEWLLWNGDTAAGCALIEPALLALEASLGSRHPESVEARARLEASGMGEACKKLAAGSGR